MKVKDFLIENKLSVGDNFRLLLERLGLFDEAYVKKIEGVVGEPAKMSKSKGNTVDPEEAIKRYGADTVRLYILFAGPVEKDFEWTEEGVQGAYRFLRRLWSLFFKHLDTIKPLSYSAKDFKNLKPQAKEIRRKAHQTLKKYLEDMQELSFNTAIASIMELVNALQDFSPQEEEDYKVLKEALELTLFMLYPLAPHICEELWHRLGKEGLMIYHRFPEPDEEALKSEEIEIPVQVNGKLRAVIRVPLDEEEERVKRLALEDPRVARLLDGKQVKKVVYVKNKLINLVVGDG